MFVSMLGGVPVWRSGWRLGIASRAFPVIAGRSRRRESANERRMTEWAVMTTRGSPCRHVGPRARATFMNRVGAVGKQGRKEAVLDRVLGRPPWVPVTADRPSLFPRRGKREREGEGQRERERERGRGVSVLHMLAKLNVNMLQHS